MTNTKWIASLALAMVALFSVHTSQAALQITNLCAEYLATPTCIDTPVPRLGWQMVSDTRGQKQTAYRLLVSSAHEKLAKNQGDLWDSGKVISDATANLPYAGKPLASGQRAFWKVKVWDKDGKESPWSASKSWSMGLLKSNDWKAQWISYKDTAPLHTDRNSLFLPAARHYRKTFDAGKKVKRAVVYASALGIYELSINGVRAGDAFLEPGWADYQKRTYYRAHDVTALVKSGQNAIGAIVADGWYAGYVGYGLLVGYGPGKVGRYFYGKTPALLAQMEIEYADGSREIISTDPTWQVTGDGPIREADIIMGESYDARLDRPDWGLSNGAKEWKWEQAIRAEDNGSTKAIFSDNLGSRPVELGFQKPPKLQAYSAPPIRITQELPARRISEPKPGVYIFDLGQNFAGIIRLKAKGPAGTKLQIRYGEMLHPDGRLMTENLRRARATDYYIFRGDVAGETWMPRFTYHGFQFVEITGLPEKPTLAAVTGLVLHNETPLVGRFECSDPILTQFGKNAQWTQRANFIEVPTDCPQRDERLGWMGDAQTYIRTSSYFADVAAFYTKWLDDLEEAQRDFGAYPDYCPYPMGHGEPGKTFGSGWTDAGIICPWTVWKVYGDTRVIERHWDSMSRFMAFREKTCTNHLGVSIGNPWGDWLNVGETTPVEYIDTCYYAYDAGLMADMAEAIGRKSGAAQYRKLQGDIQTAYRGAYVNADGSLKVDTQTAYALAIAFEMLPPNQVKPAADRLAAKVAKKDYRMATGFLGTKRILPALSAGGHHDLAVRLFQSRKFPSWGYEVVNGANSVWERWDSFTQEHGFNGLDGNQNASMNSFSHYSFGSVMEWAFANLAGIDTDGAGFKKILIRPMSPAPNSNPDQKPIDWVRAEYGSAHGMIKTDWKRDGDRFVLNLSIPANTTATLHLPSKSDGEIMESGKLLKQVKGAKYLRSENNCALIELDSGQYRFESKF